MAQATKKPSGQTVSNNGFGPRRLQRKSYELEIASNRDPAVSINYHKLEEAIFHVESLLEQVGRVTGQQLVFTLFERVRSKARDKKLPAAKFLPFPSTCGGQELLRAYVLTVEYRGAFHKFSDDYHYTSSDELAKHIRWLFGLIRGQNGAKGDRKYVITAFAVEERLRNKRLNAALPPIEEFVRPKRRTKAGGGKPSMEVDFDLHCS